MSGSFVLDCSVTMAWYFEGEATPATDVLLDSLSQRNQGVVALHWPLEVGHILLMGERRKLPLATLEKELRSAAKKVGVRCLPEKIGAGR